MKVKDLIEKLQEFDREAEVKQFVQVGGGCGRFLWEPVACVVQEDEYISFENRKVNVVYIL